METHDCSCWQNDGADSVSHCDLPFAHTEIWSPSLNPSSPIMKSSTECYVSACASEEKALHHPDLHCVLLVLSRWNLEDAIDEVIENVFSERFIKNRLSGGLSHWSTKDVKEWLLSLKLLSAYHDQLTLQVDHECIDGEALVELVCEHRLREVLQIDYVSDLILELIVSAWRTVSRDFALPKTLPISLIGVRTGYVCDLSSCSTEEATKMMEVNKSCAQCGMGGLYGQLVVLGYSEYRIVGDKWFSFGHANKTFPLIRRKLPNAVKSYPIGTGDESTGVAAFHRISISSNEADGDATEHTLLFDNDPLCDCFQIGRAACGSNDFVIPGELHNGNDSLPSGPVSRRACRIVCERLPPFRCFIHAGGFSEQREMNVKGACYQDEDSPSPLEIDGFTTFGVRFIQPEVGEWVEVSVLGRTYEPRVDSFSLPTHRKSTPLLNRLTNGSLIDIGGLIIMFQDPIAMAQQRCIHIEELIRSMNKLQPQCPVMFNEIRFHYVDPHKREQNAMLNLTSQPVNNISGHGPTHIPTTDFSELPEDQRMYVFTSCGHVFGYHSSLEQSVSCPLCRKIGPYVPLLLPFEKSICDGFPTHVFNPCGHGVSENAAIYWSRCRVYNRHIPFHRMCAICPFCATELNRSQPYSRLVVQLSSPDADWSDWCKLLEDCRGCDEFCITNYPFTEVNLERDSEEWVNLVIKAQCLYFNQRSLRSGYNQGLCGIINYCGRDDAVSAEEGERDDDDVEIYRDASRQCSVEYFDRRFIYYPTYAPQLANHPTFR